MARSTILLLALLAALVLVASARQSQQERQSRCESQVESLNLKHCERHIMQRIQQQQEEEDEDEYDEEEEEEDALRMRGVGSYLRSSQRSLKERCCNQLRELEESPKCMCKALQQIFENQSEDLRRSQKKQAEWELKNLPKRCGFQQTPRRCNVRQDN